MHQMALELRQELLQRIVRMHKAEEATDEGQGAEAAPEEVREGEEEDQGAEGKWEEEREAEDSCEYS